jgi:hypothetical protein
LVAIGAIGGLGGQTAGIPAPAPVTAPVSASTATPPPPPPPLPPIAIGITTGGTNGVGRANQPGLPCDDGGDGASWHYGYESSLPSGPFTSLPTDLRMNLDLHADGALPTLPTDAPNGFLKGSESTVSLVNERGTVVLRLHDGGACDERTARVTRTDGTSEGRWEVDHGSGSYESITGDGTFAVGAGIAPGADNPWNLQLDGDVTVDRPNLSASLVGLTWGPLGTDLITRRPWVTVRITNHGGDAFGVRLTGAASATSGATLLSGAPAELGDLLTGESAVITLRYKLQLLGPCLAVVVLCEFDVDLATSMHDALDRTATEVDRLRVRDDLLELLS